MSGIAGIFSTDGRPALDSPVRRMLAAMAHRGPDGQFAWSDRGVALGHCLLRTLPEAPAETLPLEEGELVITADARLDNREELIDALAPRDRSPSDAALLLAAYAKWGESCPEHLLGDFAFAIWDGRERILFCARDHLGVKPFFYSADPAGFSFASEMKGLFALPDVPGRIDEDRIADHLAGLIPDADQTLYADVKRLPPRHSLTVTAVGQNLRGYWRPDSSSPPFADPAEEFRALFESAVRARLRSVGPVGAMLSGGLDSSSISSVGARIYAKEQRQAFPTFSLVFDRTPEWSERRFIDAVLASGGFDPQFLDADDFPPFADFDEAVAEQDGLFQANGLAFGRKLYRAAADRGLRVLLDGHGGDEVVSHGYGRLSELAHAGRWLALWREARGIARVHREPFWPVFSGYMGRSGGRAGRLWRRTLGRQGKSKSELPSWRRFVNSEFAARSGLAERLREQRRVSAAATGDERTLHASLLLASRVPSSFEVLDRAAAACGIEPRYPFWDKRLVEFCLLLPSDEKLKDGWSRFILRRAMDGILPPAVQWRQDKLDFGPHIIRGMLKHHRSLVERMLGKEADAIADYVDVPALNAAYQRIAEKAEAADGRDVQAVWRTVVLATWLNRSTATPKKAAA